MGSSWIVVCFFFAPVLGLSYSRSSRFPLPRRRPGSERGLSGGLTPTTTPNERPQKNSSNLSLPVAYYQSPRQSQIGLVGPVCANLCGLPAGPRSPPPHPTPPSLPPSPVLSRVRVPGRTSSLPCFGTIRPRTRAHAHAHEG
jgi:hypothetical protein